MSELNKLRKTTQVIARYAAYLNLQAGNSITPSLSKVNNFLQEDYGISIVIVDSYVNTEKDGKKTMTQAWAAGRVVFVKSLDIGDLYYGMTAEERRKVAGVSYAKADDFMLISKFSENEPLAEYTSVQAYVLPVLNDVEAIYQLNVNSTSW